MYTPDADDWKQHVEDVYERSLPLVKLRTFDLFLEDEATKCLRRGVYCLLVHPIVFQTNGMNCGTTYTGRRGLTGSLSLETGEFEALTRKDKRK